MRMLLALATVSGLLGCERSSACRENVGAQSIDERIEVAVGDQSVSAELADEAVERERGWRRRVCDREALLLVPDEPTPLPVFGCELVETIDVFGLREGAVVFAEPLEPCGPPCGGCPTLGDGVTVDAVLEVPRGALDAEVGTPASF